MMCYMKKFGIKGVTVMDNVVYYQDILSRKMDIQIKFIDNGMSVPKEIYRQIKLLGDWYVNELSQEED